MYTIVDIDTGEDITNQKESLILKTISYDKRKEKIRRPDGSTYDKWTVYRLCKVIGNQRDLFEGN